MSIEIDWPALTMLLVGVSGIACGGARPCATPATSLQASTVAPFIEVEELKARMSDGKPVLLVDVRTTEEFVAGHITGALLVPRGVLELVAEIKLPDKRAFIVLYCADGKRSEPAALALRSMGFGDVHTLRQGLRAWARGGSVSNAFGTVRVAAAGEKEPVIAPPTFEPGPSELKSAIKPREQISKEATSGSPKIAADQLKAKVESGERFLLIDNRTEVEYRSGHIGGAIWIPRGVLEWVIETQAPHAETPVVIYCKRGGRSALSVKAMQGLGYSNVRSLEGGVEAWARVGYPLYNLLGKLEVLQLANRPVTPSEWAIPSSPLPEF